MPIQLFTNVRFSWLVVLTMAASPSFAGSITAELDHVEGPIDDTFMLTVTIEGAAQGELTPPEVDGLTVTPTSESRRSSYINGAMVSSVQLGFAIEATRGGVFKIPSIKLRIDGKDEATLPLTLKVAGQGVAAAPPGKNAEPAGKKDGDVFVERRCDNLSPYIGQVVRCAVKLYRRINLRGLQRLAASTPDFRRFLAEGERQYETRRGDQNYVVLEVAEIVVPLKAGTLALPPFEIKARGVFMRNRRLPLGGIFDQLSGMMQFSMGEEKDLVASSASDTMEVKPLPPEGVPLHFSGLTGQWGLSVSAEPKQINAGDTVTITISILGRGLIDYFELAPSFDKIGRTYADKPESKETIDASGIQATKTFRVAVVPIKAGIYDLGAVEVPYFDPEVGRFALLRGELGSLHVSGDAPSTSAPIAAELKQKAPTLRPLHQIPDVSRRDDLSRSLVVSVALASISYGPGIFLLGRRRFRARRVASDGREHERALLGLVGRFTGGAAESAGLDVRSSLSPLAHGYRLWLGKRLGCPGASLTPGEAAAILSETACPSELGRQLVAVLTRLDELAFRPTEPDLESLRGLAKQIAAVVEGATWS